MYLSSNKLNKEAEKKVLNARSVTTSHISRLSKWLTLKIPSANVTHFTKESFAYYVSTYRVKVLVDDVSLEENIAFYTDIDIAFLDLVASEISVPLHDRLLIALDALLRASDSVGIQRALGSSYWTPCEFPRSKPQWFPDLVSESNTYLDQVFRFHEPSLQTYTTNLRAQDPLEALLDEISSNMINPEYAAECSMMTLQERYERSSWWFDNVTIYMTKTLGPVRNALKDDLHLQLERTMKEAKDEVSFKYCSIFINDTKLQTVNRSLMTNPSYFSS